MLTVCIGPWTVWGLPPHEIRSLVGCSPNAAPELRPEAGAERTLEGVGCRRLILIEAPSSAYHGGRLRVGNITLSRGGDLMRFYTKQHPFYCGIALHARTRYVC